MASMRLRRMWFGILGLAIPAVSQAASVSNHARPGDPVSSAATPDPLAPIHNPALLGALLAPGALIEGQLTRLSLEATTTRHEGIDPNTGEAYRISRSETSTPSTTASLVWPLRPGRLGVGLSLWQPVQQSADFRGQEDSPPPITGHQRYAVVVANLQEIALTPALGLRLADDLYLGGNVSISFHRFDLLNAWDPMGSEGMGPSETEAGSLVPYTGDTYFQYHGSGTHLGWSAGVFYDGGDWLSVGASWTDLGTARTSGTGLLDLPDLIGGSLVPVLGASTLALAPVLRTAIALHPLPTLDLVVGYQEEFWGLCCGEEEGDALLSVTDEQGGSLGPDEGLSVELASVQHLPRRLENSPSFHLGALWKPMDFLAIGGTGYWQRHAVPDFSLNAVQVDFDTLVLGAYVGGQLGPFTLGFRYDRGFSQPREITTSAWDVRIVALEDDTTYYVDEHFSPSQPYTASANGSYSAEVDFFSLTLEWRPGAQP